MKVCNRVEKFNKTLIHPHPSLLEHIAKKKIVLTPKGVGNFYIFT